MSPIPVLHLRGDARERGLAHGRQAADLIHHNWDIYKRSFLIEGGLNEREVLHQATVWRQRIARTHPEYAQTMSAIADGSGLPELAVVALNVRYEILYSAFAREELAKEECTTVAVLPNRTRGKATLVAENWDWLPQVQLVWVDEHRGRTHILGATEAGVVGAKVGLNSAGVALAVNGLLSHLDRWDNTGIPFHVRCYRALGAQSLEQASEEVAEGPAPCSANFLLANTTTAVALEVSPSGSALLSPAAGVLVHTNHFLAASALGVHQPLGAERRSTIHRLLRMRHLLSAQEAWSAPSLARLLRDHDSYPHSICRHPIPEVPPDRRYGTALSVVLNVRAGEISYALGPPCRTPVTRIALGNGP